MASPPDEKPKHDLDYPVQVQAPCGAFMGSLWSLTGAGGALLLGRLGSRFDPVVGTSAAQVLAGVGVGVGSVLLPRLATGSFFPLRWTLAWMSLASGVGVALTMQTEPRLGWPYFLWALCGGGVGLLIGTRGEPIRLAKGGEGDVPFKAWLFVGVGVLIALAVAAVNPRRLGTIFATAIVGGLAGLFWGWALYFVSGEAPRRVFDSPWAVPLLGAFLGALGGGWGGGIAWGIARQRIEQARENFPDEETHP